MSTELYYIKQISFMQEILDLIISDYLVKYGC